MTDTIHSVYDAGRDKGGWIRPDGGGPDVHFREETLQGAELSSALNEKRCSAVVEGNEAVKVVLR
jgi:hypothetical protein